MTSLFDAAIQETPLPQAMVTELVDYGGRKVSLLEFAPVDLDASAFDDIAAANETFEVDERARQVAVMIEAAREAASNEAWLRFSEQEQHVHNAQLARVEAMWAELARDRRQYFAAAERQTIRLALAVARKVLGREADIDPMLLSGSVKAALSKVQDGSVSRLLVGRGQGEAWRTLLNRAEGTFEVCESDALAPDALRLETSVGEVELGMRAQLERIDRAFAELTEERAA